MCVVQPRSYSWSLDGAPDGLDIIVFKIMINKEITSGTLVGRGENHADGWREFITVWTWYKALQKNNSLYPAYILGKTIL